MSCAACERHVARALEGLTGVAHVTVDLDRRAATVEHQADVDAHSLVAAVRDAGYDARIETASPEPTYAGNALEKKLGCCGCCGG